MNVYDFDKTVYDGDSSINFTLFAMRKHPNTLRVITRQMNAIFKYKQGKISKKTLKEVLFSYLRYINETENLVDMFWKREKTKIKEFYLNQQQEDDLVISASPYFLLRPICDQLGIRNLIGSNVDIKSGKFIEENCYGKQKVIEFNKQFSQYTIDKFYSDSYSDEPLARIAREAFIVKGKDIRPW